MAVPKKRKSKAKTRSRRSANNKLEAVNVQTCPNCYAAKLPHRACMSCGFYKDEQVVEVWEEW
jgi:large subunit ribosomal protein L32